jgi:hypothetical protein
MAGYAHLRSADDQPVLPASTLDVFLGYLVDSLVQIISSDILALQDITELESNRLTDLLELVHPLENLFRSSTNTSEVSERIRGVDNQLIARHHRRA